MTCSANEAFADWLDVTYHPDCDTPHMAASWLVGEAGAQGKRLRDGAVLYRIGDDGTVRVEMKPQWSRVSASGGALSHLRAHGIFLEYLSRISEGSPRVTRLDVACDFAADGADVIRDLKLRYGGGGRVRLTRKGMPVKLLTEYRASDGRETGTFYVGHRSRSRVTARVYDKAHQMASEYGIHLPPTSRYEVTLRHGSGVTLRDAALPSPAFWHHASPALLDKPEGIPDWRPDEGFNWRMDRPEVDISAAMARIIDNSVELEHLCRLADQLGFRGRAYLLRDLRRRISGIARI